MQTASVRLLENNDPVSGFSEPQLWPGGKGVFSVIGTFDGGQVGLEYLGPDGLSYIPVPNGTVTTNSGFAFELPPAQIRASVSGSATNIYAAAERIPE